MGCLVSENETENGESLLQSKRGRLTTLRVSNEAENPEPKPEIMRPPDHVVR